MVHGRNSTYPVPLTVRTARMVLRPWSAADAPSLEPILRANTAHLTPWIPAHVATPLPTVALAERLDGFAADFAAGRAYRYAMLMPDERRILGEADLFPRAAAGRVRFPDADHLEIGYWLDAAVTGQGLATEAAGALLEVAATIPAMTRVEIHCDVRNLASAAIPRRLGFEVASVEGDLQVWRKALVHGGR